MRNFLRIALITLIVGVMASPVLAAIPTPTTTTTYQLHKSVTYSKYTYNQLYTGYQEIYVLEIDLSDTGIEVATGVCPNNKLTNTSTLGASYNAIAAINYGFFNMTGSAPSVSAGLLKAQGRVITVANGGGGYGTTDGYFWINGTKAGVVPPNRLSLSLGTEIRYGYPILVMNGRMWPALSSWTTSDSIITSTRSRTACGVSKDRSTLYCVVFDEYALNGKTRAGVNCKNLANFMIALGCHEAWNADGGGSSTIWTKQYGRMNYPQGGTYQRPVYDILFVREKGAANRDNATGNPTHSTPSTPSLLQKPTR